MAHSRLRRLARWAAGHLWTVAALGALGLAALVIATRFLLPSLDGYRSHIEAWLGADLGQQVAIRSLRAEWHGWVPELRADGVRLLDRRGQTQVNLGSVAIRLDLPASLRRGAPRISHLTAHGATIHLVRRIDGGIHICCLGEEAAADPSRDTPLGGGYLEHGSLELADSTLIWDDRRTSAPPLSFSQINLRLRVAGPHHQLDGELNLPQAYGKRLRFAADMIGTPAKGDWSGRLFVAGADIDLGELLRNLPVGGLRLTRGHGQLRLWSTWENGRAVEFLGDAALQDLSLADGERAFPLERLAGKLRLRRDPAGDWDLVVEHGRVTTGSGPWPETGLQVRVQTGAGGERTVRGFIDRLSLEQLRPHLPGLLHDRPQIAQWLVSAAPSANLSNLSFRYRPARPEGERLSVAADFDALRFAAVGRVPGIDGLAGRIRADGASGRLALPRQRVRTDLPTLFDLKLPEAELEAALSWRSEPGSGAWWLYIDAMDLATADVATRLTGKLRVSDEPGSPFVYLLGSYRDADLAAIDTYVPAMVMHKKAVRWVRRAIVSGHSPSGGLLIHGKLGDFPFDDGSGRFEVRSNVEQAILDYKPEWPRMEEIQAEVVFHGRSLDIHSTSAKILGTDVHSTGVHVANLVAEVPVLEVDGRTRGEGNDGLRILLESPLRGRFERHLRGARIDGPVQIAMHMQIPLVREPPKVQGQVDFQGNHLQLDLLKLDLRQVSGKLAFTESMMSARDLRARLMNEPVTLAVETLPADGGTLTRIRVDGSVDRESLARQLPGPAARDGAKTPPHWLSRVSGKTRWQATLDVPEVLEGPDARPGLRVESDLVGLALDLPPPFGKTADEARRLSIDTVLGPETDHLLSVKYGNLLRALLRLSDDGSRQDLERGAIFLGAAEGGLPSRPGLRVTGDVAEFSTSAWADLLQGAGPDARTNSGTIRTGPGLKQLDISVARFEVLNQWFDAGHITAARSDGGDWQARLDAAGVAGSVTIPHSGSKDPIKMEFEQLTIAPPPPASDAHPAADPRRIPPLEFSCRDFKVRDIPLGEVHLKTQPRRDGMHIDQLTMSGASFKVRASGDWQTAGERQISRFDISLTSPDLGAMLATLGYDRAALDGGNSRMELSSIWEGSPSQFALERANGVLRLEVLGGRLTDVSPGAAGRVFGLISLQALPRRLNLDFSDLFKKGLTYDRIAGTFTIDSGDAYTNDLTMTAPAARIDIAGRVGLASRDYDQIVTVTPSVATTLPLAGAIAGGPIGAAVGVAAAYIADKLFKNDVKQVIKTQYVVTGNWDDPLIERVRDGEVLGVTENPTRAE